MDLTHEDVLEILAILDAADLEHFELRTGDTVIVAGRHSTVVSGPTQAQVSAQAPAPAPASSSGPLPGSVDGPAAVPPAESSGTPSEPSDGLVDVTAPVVGVFYRTPEPGAPPYVEVGDHVDAGTTLGLVEVMKMFTGVTAPVSGTISEVLVATGEFVEYSQPLLRISPDPVN